MPANPVPRRRPNDADPARAPDTPGTADAGKPAPLFSTFGLAAGWERALDWAQANDVVGELLVLVDAALIGDRHDRLGTLLQEITRPVARDCLDQWRTTDRAAAILHRLSEAASREQRIVADYPPLTTDSPARIQLGEQTRQHYLFALILEQLPPIAPEAREGFATLRLWLLVHGVERALAGNVHDRHLQTVATALRLACDRHDGWRTLIGSLTTPAQGLDEFNAFLALRATKRKNDPAATAAHRKFCQALISVARNEHHRDESLPAELLSGRFPAARWAAPAVPEIVLEWPDASDEPMASVWPAEDLDADGDLIETGVDARQSYFHQSLQAGAVLLLSAEELQLLPWSWARPNPQERGELECWIEHLIRRGDARNALLGTLVWISSRTGRSLRRTLDLPIGSAIGNEWSLDGEGATLYRQPPMRRPGWEAQTEAEHTWVVPLAASNRIRLPEIVSQALRAALKSASDATRLGDLWPGPDTPEAAFRRQRQPSLARITPGMLGNALPQVLYAQSADPAFARLMASHPQSGIPAACAYASWRIPAVEAHLAQTPPVSDTPPASGGPPIGGGSRLDPIDSLLVGAIAQAAQRLEQWAIEADPVRFHNAYAAYVAVALLAATGARPVHDPFETLAHFDFDFPFCFINDKTSSDAHAGRLVPLPRAVAEWIRTDYGHYLARLAQVLGSGHPGLARDIVSLRDTSCRPRMPLLFMLSEQDELTWTPVSEKSIDATGLFDWPLPLNLFRHRLSQRLRRQALDAEIIDAILGHAEHAAATHGDDSVRVWQEDMALARPALEAAFQSLDFPLVKCAPRSVPPMSRRVLPSEAPRPYGIAAREAARQARASQAREHAAQLMADFLGERALSELAEDEINALAKVLLFTEKGLPRALAPVYYQVLSDSLEKLWQERGARARITRRYAWAKPPPTPFSAQAPGALALHRALAEDLDTALASCPASRLSLRECAGLAVALLSIDHRITDPKVLCAVAESRHFRLVKLQTRRWLEYGKAIARNPRNPDLAVRAFPVSARTASVLDRLLGGQKGIRYADEPPAGLLAPLARRLEAFGRESGAIGSVCELAQRLASLIDQVNAMTWPGVVAGYMAGRVASSALGWRDRIRMEFGAPARFDATSSAESREESAGSVVPLPCALGEPERMHGAARRFFAGLRRILSEQATDIEDLLPGTETASKKSRGGHPASPPTLNTHPSPSRRRDLARLAQRYLHAWNGQVSTAVFLLGQWAAALLHRRARGQALLSLSAIRRYLGALSPPFEAAAYPCDLLSMDQEDLTVLYEQILTVGGVEDSAYVAARLGEFHRWAAGLGAEEPDWSALPQTAGSARVSPGVLTEADYQAALRLLAHRPTDEPHQRLAHAFLLLGCHRFGLRGAECLGLARDDWIDDAQGTIVVLVRNNRFRTLKTPAARRQVPLLFELSALEREVMARFLLTAESFHGDQSGAPLFAQSAESKTRFDRLALTAVVNQALKQVTGHPGLSLHHVRHTAINRIAVALLSLPFPVWQRACALDGRAMNRPDIPAVLLGKTGPTRRSAWAMARYLGHAGTGTLFRNYLHNLDEWIRHLPGASLDKPALGRPTREVDLEAVPRAAPIDTALLELPPAPSDEITADQALQLMRLLARGKPLADAAAALSIGPPCAEAIASAADAVGRRMRLRHLDRPRPPTDEADGTTFLRRITEAGWHRLIHAAKAAHQESVPKTEPMAAMPCLADAARMIGPTRQLVMWGPEHFALVRAVCDFLGIGTERYVVVHSADWTRRHQEAARAAGFAAMDAKSAGGRRILQLDSVVDGDNDNRVEKRCVFLFQQNADFAIRDRMEMAVVFLAVAAVLCPLPSGAR